jgi:hypothetical protein
LNRGRVKKLSLRKSEVTSLNRVRAFNKKKVDKFYKNLEEVFTNYNFAPSRIYNVDETGISNVHEPRKIFTKKGQTRVGELTSGERETNTTVCYAVSAIAPYIPHMFIFAPNILKKNGPPDAIYRGSQSGWTTEDLFLNCIAPNIPLHPQ